MMFGKKDSLPSSADCTPSVKRRSLMHFPMLHIKLKGHHDAEFERGTKAASLESLLQQEQNENEKEDALHDFCDHKRQFNSWSESFEKLLADQDGVDNFLQYSESEHSSENIRFWIACEEYKKCVPDTMATKASEIYDEFLSLNGANQVNIDSYQIKNVERLMETPNSWTFESVQREIFILMKRNSYPRFLKSLHYQNLFKKSCSHSKSLASQGSIEHVDST